MRLGESAPGRQDRFLSRIDSVHYRFRQKPRPAFDVFRFAGVIGDGIDKPPVFQNGRAFGDVQVQPHARYESAAMLLYEYPGRFRAVYQDVVRPDEIRPQSFFNKRLRHGEPDRQGKQRGLFHGAAVHHDGEKEVPLV